MAALSRKEPRNTATTTHEIFNVVARQRKVRRHAVYRVLPMGRLSFVDFLGAGRTVIRTYRHH